MTSYSVLHDHQKAHHKLVNFIMKFVAKDVSKTVSECHILFRDQNQFITEQFWLSMQDYLTIHDLPTNSYVGVYYCHSCKRYSLVEGGKV